MGVHLCMDVSVGRCQYEWGGIGTHVHGCIYIPISKLSTHLLMPGMYSHQEQHPHHTEELSMV